MSTWRQKAVSEFDAAMCWFLSRSSFARFPRTTQVLAGLGLDARDSAKPAALPSEPAASAIDAFWKLLSLSHTPSNNLDDARTRLGLRTRTVGGGQHMASACYTLLFCYTLGETAGVPGARPRTASSTDPDGEDIKGSSGPLQWRRVGATEDGGRRTVGSSLPHCGGR